MVKRSAFALLFMLWSTSCGVYSFTGTAVTAETISIKTFFNDAANGPNNLGVIFTDKLRDYFQQNTTLVQVDEDGELQLEGAVVSYRLSPVAPSAAQSDLSRDVANLTRLTITVKVEYVDLENEDNNFTRNFSHFADFDSDLGLTAVENELLDVIFQQIILDIFNATVANW